jgi:hypothetical protein
MGNAAVARPNSPPIVAIRRTSSGDCGSSGWRSIASLIVTDGRNPDFGINRTANRLPASGCTCASRTGT